MCAGGDVALWCGGVVWRGYVWWPWLAACFLTDLGTWEWIGVNSTARSDVSCTAVCVGFLCAQWIRVSWPIGVRGGLGVGGCARGGWGCILLRVMTTSVIGRVGGRGCGLLGAVGGWGGVGGLGLVRMRGVKGEEVVVSGVLRLLGRRRREEWYVRTVRLLG